MPTTTLEVRGLVKRYDRFTAVDHLSFDVYEGEIFGLLGPNGAGKTTSIRCIMDIFKPDEGTVKLMGQPAGAARTEIGYLPEERGLYRDLRVLDVLVYLGELKGMSRAHARERAAALLDKVELTEWAGRKVRDLSRGMQQKVQLVASLVHDPQFVILDEPFAGLDPVNVVLFKDLLREFQAEGKTIVLSVHQMNLVEELCDRILLINHGQAVLYGELAEIKARYAAHSVSLRTPAPLPSLAGVSSVEHHDHTYVLTLQGASPQELLRSLLDQGVPVESFEVASAPLQDIFIAAVKEADHA